MCGIVGLHLRDPKLFPRLGPLLGAMMCQVGERGPDSAGVGLYGDRDLSPPGHSAVSLVSTMDIAGFADRLAGQVPEVGAFRLADTVVVHGALDPRRLERAVTRAVPDALVVGRGEDLVVLKGVGRTRPLAEAFRLDAASGWQGVAHTRMATESAVTPAHCHPFSVADDLCLVHNGSFANHATIRRELEHAGHRFDSDNDSEVAARYVGARLADGDDLEKALRLLCERFDGFYTLLVTTRTSFAVVRDAVACKPAVVAVTDGWVAMASEYRALEELPEVATAKVFEPEPEEVYVWSR